MKTKPKARKLIAIPTCRINGRKCPECGIVHGREAEELRCAFEAVIQEWGARFDPLDPRDAAERIQKILDDTDARDALAYVEATVRKRRRA